MSTGNKVYWAFMTGLALVAAYLFGWPWLMSILPPSQAEITRAVVSYLAQPAFAGEGLAQRLFGIDVELEILDLDEKKAYFSMSNRLDFEQSIKLIARQLRNVEAAKLQADGLVLGKRIYTVPGRYFFRLPANEVLIDPNQDIAYWYGEVKYDITPAELQGYISNRSIYQGPLRVEIARHGDVVIFMHNRSPFIAKKGEPSMKRLAERIIDRETTLENNIQRLLDFTVLNINYAESDKLTSAEVLKRPNEVLMVRQGNCGNKTILFASLLEQIRAEYLILYLPKSDHASVAVTGNFSNDNSLSFQYGGKVFSLAEPTINTRFVVGQTRIPGMKSENIEYVQRPGGKIFSLQEKKFLPFF